LQTHLDKRERNKVQKAYTGPKLWILPQHTLNETPTERRNKRIITISNIDHIIEWGHGANKMSIKGQSNQTANWDHFI